jgi:subtilisin family serine protease
VTGSRGYLIGGADGHDIRIAVIDHGFIDLDLAQASDDAPDTFVESIDFEGGGIETETDHGTKCLEIIYDHAPGATYCIYRIGNSSFDIADAVNAAVAANVDIISMSLTYSNQGWGDNTGNACAAVTTATNAGILFFVSAGNTALHHWKGLFKDNDNDGWHEWFIMDEGNASYVAEGGELNVFLQWDTSGGTFNYELYLFDHTLTIKIDSSKNPGNEYEVIHYDSPVDQYVTIAVKETSENPREMQLFALRYDRIGADIERYHPEGSITSPGSSTESNLISVGAVAVSDYLTPPGPCDIIYDYSSQGPTIDGNIKPELCAPTDCAVSISSSTFGGTSCASPNAAGTAAAFWSSAPYLDATGTRHLLLEMAAIFKDWGDAGFDNIYGRGGIALHTFHAKTFWVDRDALNVLGYITEPYFFIADAQEDAVEGGRIVILGDNYPEPIVLDKELLYESIGGPAILGQ